MAIAKRADLPQFDKPLAETDYTWIINNPKLINIYHVYLNEEISEQKHYREIFNCLREADENDCFVFYMNNFGGYVHTAIDLINAMRQCKGQIVVKLTGPIYSAAPLIALQGHYIVVEDFVFMMFHDYSGRTAGKGHEQESAIRNDKPFFDDMFADCVKGFLTAQEIKNVNKGQDLYLDRASIIKRLKRIRKLGNA